VRRATLTEGLSSILGSMHVVHSSSFTQERPTEIAQHVFVCCPLLLSCLQRSKGAAGMRAAIAAEGFSSIQTFLDHAAAANKQYIERVLAEQEQRRVEHEARRAEAAQRHLEQLGKWGSQYAGVDAVACDMARGGAWPWAFVDWSAGLERGVLCVGRWCVRVQACQTIAQALR
jgi:hypothetical protein